MTTPTPKQRLIEAVREQKAQAENAKQWLAEENQSFPKGYIWACDEVLAKIEEILE